MLVTVTNTSGAAINVAETGEDGVALGGGNHPDEATHRSNPLPYPFAHIGELADSGTKELAMHPSDWRYGEGGRGSQMARGLSAREKWNLLVAAGTVTLATAAQADRVENEELFLNAV